MSAATPSRVNAPAKPGPRPTAWVNPSMLLIMPPMPPWAKSWTTRPVWSAVWPRPARPLLAAAPESLSDVARLFISLLSAAALTL